jgi:hypothetical protein
MVLRLALLLAVGLIKYGVKSVEFDGFNYGGFAII